MNKTMILSAICTVFCAVNAYADDIELQEYIDIAGGVCEEQKNGEDFERIVARIKDKAGFSAVSNLEKLEPAKKKLNTHDFDVLVYNIIDEDLENMLTKSNSTEDGKVCVEVSGRIRLENLDNKMAKSLSEHGMESPVDAVVASVEDDMKHLGKTNDHKAIAIEDRGLIYVAPTTFYNGAVSENHSKLLKHLLSESQFFYITDNKNIADFIVMPRVEKARVDTIDENSSRLQMQVIMNVLAADDAEFINEQQSRSIVFDHEQTEQQNAQKLLKTLFAKSAKRIQSELEKFYSEKIPSEPIN